MKNSAGFVLALLLANGLVNRLAYGQASAPTPPGNGSATWNASTVPPPTPPPVTESVLSVRVYDDLNRKGQLPYQAGRRRPEDPAYAADVSAVMTRCPDDSLIITGLVIGGRVTPLDARCPGTRDPPPVKPTPACDANRWNCTTTPAN